MPDDHPNELVFPLYRKEEWPRWLELFENTNAPMTPTFDEWRRHHVEDCANFRARGYGVHEMEVGIDDYVAWTRAKNLPVNGSTRTDFALQSFIERLREKGDL